MLIDFHCLEETVIKNFYGGEKDTRAKMFTDDLHHHIMYSRLAPGASIWVHRHDRGSEIIHILQGSGKACYDEEREELWVGSCHYCPKGHAHSSVNDGSEDLIFLDAIVQQ